MDTPHPPAKRIEPLTEPEEKTGRKYFERNTKNARTGRILWFRVRVQGMSTHDAWVSIFPNGSKNRRSIQQQASRFLRWYEENYPGTFHEIAAAFDLTPQRMGEQLDEMFHAKVWRWDPKQEKHVETDEPNWKVRTAAFDRLLKLIEKDEKWRRQFIEQDESRPVNLATIPEFKTMEEFEAWKANRDILKEIEEKRKQAMEAHERVVEAEGRKLPPPPVNGAHH